MERCGRRGRKEGHKINTTALFSWIILFRKKPQNTDVYVQLNKWKQGKFLAFFSMWCARWELTLCTPWKKCTKGLITQAIANQSSHSWMRVKTKLSCSKKYVKSILTTDSWSKSLFRDTLHNPPPSLPPHPLIPYKCCFWKDSQYSEAWLKVPQQILLRKGRVRQDSCPAGSHTSVLRDRHCCARAARARENTDTAQMTPWRVCGDSSGQVT